MAFDIEFHWVMFKDLMYILYIYTTINVTSNSPLLHIHLQCMYTNMLHIALVSCMRSHFTVVSETRTYEEMQSEKDGGWP